MIRREAIEANALIFIYNTVGRNEISSNMYMYHGYTIQ